VREHNEDAYIEGEAVFAVADGMGGSAGGEVASSTALLPIMQLEGRSFPDAATARDALVEAFIKANAAVLNKAREEPKLWGMGTTLTVAIVDGSCLHMGHVGDSRAYLVRNGQMTQLTRDHTIIAELMATGQLTAEEAVDHPLRSAIARAVGVQGSIDVDTFTLELVDCDQVLLCSDGLTRSVDEDEVLSVLRSEKDVHEAAQSLVHLANQRGGPDNITVLLLRYEDDDLRAGENDTPVDFSRSIEQPFNAASRCEPDHRARSLWQRRRPDCGGGNR